MIALYGNIAAVTSFSAIVCVSIMDAASYFPIEWYARCVNTLFTIGGTVLFYAASKVLRKGKNPPSDYESAFLYHALLHNPVYLWYCAGQGRDVSAVHVNLKEFSAI